MSICYFFSHCKWSLSAVFYGYSPEIVHRQVTSNDDQNCNYHGHIRMLLLSNQKSDCSIDISGLVHPGQKLQTNLCSMCSTSNSISTVLYAEVHNINLPSSSCKIVHQSQLIQFIGNHSNTVNYIIASSAPESDKCELFLTASPFLNIVYNAFYVQLLPCPVGFTLQDGVCDCDPILTAKFYNCYIELLLSGISISYTVRYSCCNIAV